MSDRLKSLLGGPLFAELIAKLDRRLAKRPEIAGAIVLREPTPETREAIMSLLGKPPKPTGTLRVSLPELDEVIRDTGAAAGLIDAITMLLGRPPQHAAIEKRKQADAWSGLAESIDHSDEATRDFTQTICQDGTLRRAARGSLDHGRQLIEHLVACVAELPLADPTPLPIFATRVLGDAHGLDAGIPLTALLMRAIAQVVVDDPTLADGHPRMVWNAVNVVADELSSTVLVLGLFGTGDGLIDHTLCQHARAGEPCRLTFRQLRLHAPLFTPPTVSKSCDGVVFVCENPSVLAVAADRLGANSRPLICIEGQPSHAAAGLLGSLQGSGVSLRYHGDYDRSGLQIAAQMQTRFAAQPWRMSASDYEPNITDNAPSFKGEVPETLWDPALAGIIEDRRRVLLEESVIDGLMSDLALLRD